MPHVPESEAMKVTGPAGPVPGNAPRAARPAAGFAVASGAASSGPVATTSAAPLSGVAGLSSLVALQGVDDVAERRRRAIRRGRGLLDRLDELKLAMLGGEASENALDRLSRTLKEEREDDADKGLTDLLNQIDLRAAVELAKAQVRRNAP